MSERRRCICACGWQCTVSRPAKIACRKCRAQLFCDATTRKTVSQQLRSRIAQRTAATQHLRDWIMFFRRPEEIGLGDTIERLIATAGDRHIAERLQQLARTCGCRGADRQAEWNARYPYDQPPIRNLLAVTSLSPHAHHQDSQLRALASWKRFGLHVLSVNTRAEAKRLAQRYSQVDEWSHNENEASWCGRRTQYVRNLVQVAADRRTPILLINSDVEISGRQSVLLDWIARGRQSPDVLQMATRWNYQHRHDDATEFQYGFDVLVIRPEQVDRLPVSFPYGIGQPVWDYAAPLLMAERFDVLHQPLFFHKNHPLNWSAESWELGAEQFDRLIGSHIDHENTPQWRQRFEPHMIYDMEAGRYVHRTDT